MNISSLLTCGFAVSLLALSGCANTTQTAHTVPQKKTASQTSYAAQNPAPGQSVTISRSSAQPATPAAPIPVQGTALAPVAMQNNLNGKVKVAILLPLSGKNAGLGQAMLNAAQQAVFDAAGTNFELQPHDTAADGGAEAATRDAVNGGAQLIIGPLFATDIPIAKAIAENANVQMLTLSTDTSLAEHGVYVMGLAPAGQVERVVAYAAAHTGAHHFAALVPGTPYGTIVGQAFKSAVENAGGILTDYQTYDPATHNSEDRVKILAAERDSIDALFLPESGTDLKMVADQASAAGFTPAHTHILGTGLWDVPNIGHLSPLLIGGWYVAPDPAARKNFVAGYTAAYGQEPPRLATLAYDATALAAVLTKRGGRYDEAALTNPNGFAGLDGIFRLLPGGQVERALAVNEITPDSVRVIDPSPSSFVTKN